MIYHALFERGLTSSQRHFSKEWLGMAANYVAEHPTAYSLNAFRHLHDRLRDAGQIDLADLAIAIAFERPHPWLRAER